MRLVGVVVGGWSVAAGYKMAHFELASSLPGAPAEDVPTLDWIFTPALDGIGRPGGETGLDVALAVGRSLFFKPARWLWARHSPKRGGSPARAGQALRRAGATAVYPVRAVVTAPFAVGASLATRAYLRAIDRRFTRRRRKGPDDVPPVG